MGRRLVLPLPILTALLALPALAADADHLKCHTAKFAGRFDAVARQIVDELGVTRDCRLLAPQALCVPAEKIPADDPRGVALGDFVRYRIACDKAPVPEVRVHDQFLDAQVRPRKPVALLVPTDGGPTTDDLVCYKVRPRPRVESEPHALVDRFGRDDGAKFARPREVCLPVRNGPMAGSPLGAFVGYRMRLQMTASGVEQVTDPFLGTVDARLGRSRIVYVPAETAADASRFGRWIERDGLPAFRYEADHETVPEAEWDPLVLPVTRRHWAVVGNRSIQMLAANDGGIAVFDESHGERWVTAPDPGGTGFSVIEESGGGLVWGTDYAMRPAGPPPVRTFGPTWFEVAAAHDGLHLERLVLVPEGEAPWVLVRVRLTLDSEAPASRSIEHVERWALAPRFLNFDEFLFIETPAERRANALMAVSYDVQSSSAGILATEQFATEAGAGAPATTLIGPPLAVVLEGLGGTAVAGSSAGAPHPTLELRTPLTVASGETRELWFRFGKQDGSSVADPAAVLAASLAGVAARVPRAEAARAPQAAREIPWHAAMLTGNAAADAVLGGHTLNQGSAYQYEMGFNGAARDPLQHAIPLVYSEPDLALSVLRNTLSWGSPDGDLPYAIDGKKVPITAGFRPSDQQLWALWLAAEYAAATGDLAAFDAPLSYHPVHGADPVTLREALIRAFRFFIDVVGRGERNYVRILNADWADTVLLEAQAAGVPEEVMIEQGSSVMNTAMGAWILDVFAGLAMRLGEAAVAAEAHAEAEELRGLVREAWNGQWFDRAYGPGDVVIGRDGFRLDVQGWAVVSGAATRRMRRKLLDFVATTMRPGSPLGSLRSWPVIQVLADLGLWGEGATGSVWYALNAPLVWATARHDPDAAWDEWRRLSLAAHTFAYPDTWEGTLSGPDAWNGPLAQRPGRTWHVPQILAPGNNMAMQAFPVHNLHSHAQPLLAYMRLLGVEPTADGALRIGKGARFESATFRVEANGHGSLEAVGPVVLETKFGTVTGGPGSVTW